MAGAVEAAIRAKVKPGTTLTTFAQKKPFEIQTIDDKGVVLLLGNKKRARPRLTWSCLEGAACFMKDKDWLSLGGFHSAEGDPGTLDEYFKRYIKMNVARWVGRLLSEACVVDVQYGRPVQVKLRPRF